SRDTGIGEKQQQQRQRDRKEMEGELAWLALLLVHALLVPCASAVVGRGDFPPNFLFGTSTSAYQGPYISP
ncbi:hypothetical protein EJB05_38791, partial [Eragrostis curvula]